MSLEWFLAGVGIGAVVWAAAALCARRKRRQRAEASDARHQQALAELSQLAGGLAHEIKNPLSTINVNLGLLAEDLQRRDDEEHHRWLRRLLSVQQEADRLKTTLDEFQRLAGRMELAPETVDLRTLVDELVDFFGPQAEADGVLLRSDLPDEPVVCSVDVKLIKQALLNLLLNAVQAMPEGGEMLLRLCRSEGFAHLEVIDTGPGLAPEDLQRIFNVYYSTKTGGSGLGLPTTRRIIREHGGDIRVESEVGKGTRFILMLPLPS